MAALFDPEDDDPENDSFQRGEEPASPDDDLERLAEDWELPLAEPEPYQPSPEDLADLACWLVEVDRRRELDEAHALADIYDAREDGLPVANGPKTTLRHNPINEQGFGQSLVASFWSSKSDLGLDFLDFEMTLRP